MKKLIEVQKKLLPDLLETMRKRYSVLNVVRMHEPIGRRSLASALFMTERVLRSEVSFLKDQGLLTIQTSGMSLTTEGHDILVELSEMMKELSGLHVLESGLKEMLNLSEVIVVPGDSDQELWLKTIWGKRLLIE